MLVLCTRKKKLVHMPRGPAVSLTKIMKKIKEPEKTRESKGNRECFFEFFPRFSINVFSPWRRQAADY